MSGWPIGQITTNTYDFTGKVTASTETYSGQVTPIINKWFTYDHAGRLEKVEQEIVGDNTNKWVVLAQNDYNEQGQLMLKKLHMANETGHVQDIDYQYDVRGWLKSINNFKDTTYRKLYAQELDYFANGNINLMSWENTRLNVYNWVVPTNKQQYTFTYDGLNRMDNAVYSERDTLDNIIDAKNNIFDENPGYDLNCRLPSFLDHSKIEFRR